MKTECLLPARMRVALVLCLALAAGPSHAGQVVVDPYSASPTVPIIVPANLFTTVYRNWPAADRAVVSEAWYDEFTAWVADQGAKGRSGQCVDGDPDGFILGTPMHAVPHGSVTVMNRALNADAVVLGHVVSQQSGFDLRTKSVVTLVTLELDEVLKDTDAALGIGQQVRFVRRSGSMNVGGVVLCSYLDSPNQKPETPQTFSQASASQVLVIGRTDPANPAFIESTSVDEFVVIDEKIYYPARVPQFQKKATDLSELINFLG